MRSVSRRQLLWAGGVAAAGAALGGTGYLVGVRANRGPEPGPGVLTVLSGWDESPGGQRLALVQDWNATHPERQARIVEVGGVADGHRSEMVARAQSGDSSIDIYNLDVTWIAEFAEAGYIQPLDTSDLDLGGFLEAPLRTCRYGGELWALPFNTDAGLLYYRSDLTRPDQVPRDWGGLEARLAGIFEGVTGPSELAAGYATQLADYEGLTVNALERIWADSGEVVEGDWWQPDVQVESERSVAALCQLSRVFATEDPPLILPESAEFDESATTQAFQAGKVAFMRNWPVAYRMLESDPVGAAGGDQSAPPVPFDVTTLPGPSVLGGQNLAIARHSPRPRLAQELITFLTGEQSQRRLFLDGGLAATRDGVYDDLAVAARYPYAGLLREAIREARSRPVTPYYARFSEVFRRGVRSAMRSDCRLPAGFSEELSDALRGLRR